MSLKGGVFPNGENGFAIASGTETIGVCRTLRNAEAFARLLEGDDTHLPGRPPGLPKVQCFENEDGSVDVVVGANTVMRCATWRWATQVAMVVEVDEYRKLMALRRALAAGGAA